MASSSTLPWHGAQAIAGGGDVRRRSSVVDEQLVPFSGRLLIEGSGRAGRFLVDKLSLRKQPLPVGEWELVYDDDGWCALQNLAAENDDEGIILVEDFMDRQV